MTYIPASVEAHLLGAGFSKTELLVLRHLSNGETYTLRQLAAKSGKSTGVLDQATRKLIEKGIIEKDMVNDKPKYVLVSIEAISEWIASHTNQTVHQLKRQEQDITAFLQTLKETYRRPQLEYYEGEEGMLQAFKRIAESDATEHLVLASIRAKEEIHYLHPFFEDYSRERRRRGIELKVITHDSIFGRRFRDHDYLAFRKTVLIPPSLSPCHCDQIIAGDTLACFRPEEQSACLLKFSLLAEGERRRFDALWAQYERLERLSAHDIDLLPLSLLEGLPVLA